MSDEAELGVSPAVAETAKIPMMGLIVGIVLAALVSTGGVGGALYWFIRSGRLSLQSPTKTEGVAAAEVKTKLVPLDPLLVNLADPDGHSFLRVAVTLKVEDPPLDKKEKAAEPEKGAPKNAFDALERDAAIEVLSKETAADLLSSGGKEHLKKQLQSQLKEQVPEVKVVEVLFTEFLVQR